MADQQIRFDDGAAYENVMGAWSRLVGDAFLDWVKPPTGKAWLDVGCGNGAFTDLVVARCAPASIVGIDPSESQLAAARAGFAPGSVATFHEGDAMALAFADGSFDIAASALVIFFMPDPDKGVAEMARVVRPGGIVSSYAWDLQGGGFPYEPLHVELKSLGAPALAPPHPEVAHPDALRRLWTAAGLADIEVRTIEVRRPFPSIDAYWSAAMTPGIRPVIAGLSDTVVAGIKDHLKAKFSPDASGAIAPPARAFAVTGRRR